MWSVTKLFLPAVQKHSSKTTAEYADVGNDLYISYGFTCSSKYVGVMNARPDIGVGVTADM